MISFENLFNKINKTISERKIKHLDFDYSIYGKRIVIIINGKRHDISKNISSDIWEIGGKYKSPNDTYIITVEVTKRVRDYVKEFDPNFDVTQIVGMG